MSSCSQNGRYTKTIRIDVAIRGRDLCITDQVRPRSSHRYDKILKYMPEQSVNRTHTESINKMDNE